MTIAKRGISSRISDGNFVSRPTRQTDDWRTFFHPIYGVCIEFSPIAKSPKDFVGSAGIQYLKVSVDFNTAFPHLQDNDDENITTVSFTILKIVLEVIWTQIHQNTLF